jgi:hypothetical protein
MQDSAARAWDTRMFRARDIRASYNSIPQDLHHPKKALKTFLFKEHHGEAHSLLALKICGFIIYYY